SCVRKFPNTNSENRHTYCITKTEVEQWEEKNKLQECFRNINLTNNINTNTIENENNQIDFSIQTINEEEIDKAMENNNMYNLIDQIDNLKFDDISLDECLTNDFNRLFHTPKKKIKLKENKAVQTEEIPDEEENIDSIFYKIYIGTKI